MFGKLTAGFFLLVWFLVTLGAIIHDLRSKQGPCDHTR